MALYEVIRTDDVQPGEFISGYVIAGGAGQARSAVAHLPGAVLTGKRANLFAEKVELTNGVKLISVYEDEREPAATGTDQLPFTD